MPFPSVAIPHMVLNGEPEIPTIPMPSLFKGVNFYTYSGNSFVSPALGAKGALTPEIIDPDIRIITPPDKFHWFATPSESEYIVVPPTASPTAEDPTGMKAMMEFMGFNKAAVDGGMAGINAGTVQPSAVSNAGTPLIQSPAVGSANPAAIPNVNASQSVSRM